MRDWKTAALALNSGIPEEALDGIGKPLDALEAAFEPLKKLIHPEDEPALQFVLDHHREGGE
ncbi:MAG: hypothetical protein FJW40_18675 [Acidobacteria bacterium]|nr:hypothetical protein [Acidobacteriota bacterium]